MRISTLSTLPWPPSGQLVFDGNNLNERHTVSRDFSSSMSSSSSLFIQKQKGACKLLANLAFNSFSANIISYNSIALSEKYKTIPKKGVTDSVLSQTALSAQSAINHYFLSVWNSDSSVFVWLNSFNRVCYEVLSKYSFCKCMLSWTSLSLTQLAPEQRSALNFWRGCQMNDFCLGWWRCDWPMVGLGAEWRGLWII